MTARDLDRAYELLQFINGSGIEKYDCSTRNESDWYLEGEKRTVLGVYYIASGILFQLTANLVLISMLKNQEQMKMSCLKIMFYIGFLESTEIWATSFFNGFICLVGGVFCTHPTGQMIFGKLTMFQWLSSSLGCVVLALNRLAEFLQFPFLLAVFDKAWKTYIILFLVTVYGLYYSVCSDTPTFNSKYGTVMLMPLNDYDQSQFDHLPFWHNPSVCILMFIIYLLICCRLFTHKSTNWSDISRMQRNLVIQSFLLSFLYIVPSAFLFYTVFIDSTSRFAMIFGQLTYQWSSGLPCVIYLYFNRAIRETSFRMIGLKAKIGTVADISTRSEQYAEEAT